MAYDDPAFLTAHQQSFVGAAGTTGTNGYFNPVEAVYARQARVDVRTAGTAAGCVVVIREGTTAITTVTMGTNTAGYSTSVDLTDTLIGGGSNEALNFMMAGDATGVMAVTYEYRYDPAGSLPSA